MELLPLIMIIPLRIISPLLLQKIAISRENSQSAVITLGKREDFKLFDSGRKMSKDVTLNHNGSSISDPSDIAEVFNNYFSNIASNLDRDIPHSNISPLYYLRASVENSFFCQPC